MFATTALIVHLNRSAVLEGLALTIGGMSMATVLLMWWWMKRTHLSWSSLGFKPLSWRILHVTWQAPLVLLSALLVQVVFAAAVNVSPSEFSLDTAALEVSLPGTIVLLVAMIVLVPVWEEMVFRGVILNAFKRRFTPSLALIMAAGVFAIAHVAFPVFPYLFTLGLGLGLVYAFHRNIWASIIVHVFVNFLASAAAVSELLL